ncbi:MAG: M18 family aminopeptidase [Eubacteriales bacterium]|nr:M18 family aminopeptidase [Eubacteriales bacterium]
MSEQLNFEKTNQELLAFLDGSPSSFHAAANMKTMLEEAGFIRLLEGQRWKLETGKGYFVTRNDSALIAFRIPKKDFAGFQIMASHSDSPVFKIKSNAEIQVENHYVKLNVEKYGGMIYSPWMDRPLSVAGRIVVQTADGVATRLICVDRDLLVIPNLAIHMNRQVNEGYAFNAQKDMLPLFCGGREEARGTFLSMIAREAGVKAEDILDTDLFLYSRMKGTVVGLDGEYICSPHLDDLQCAFASLKGFLAAEPKESVAVHCVLDNEEVGSSTKQGAASTFLKDVLHRINGAMGRTEEEYLTALASSFMVSADNAHGVHPNQPDKADPTNRPYLNEGIVIKYSANQKYTTDAVSGAVFKALCRKAGVPFQTFHNRSDILGGSTLGNISGNQVAVNTVDIGLPQLAMHSCCETAGSRDTAYLIEAARVLFSSAIRGDGDGNYSLA